MTDEDDREVDESNRLSGEFDLKSMREEMDREIRESNRLSGEFYLEQVGRIQEAAKLILPDSAKDRLQYLEQCAAIRRDIIENHPRILGYQFTRLQELLTAVDGLYRDSRSIYIRKNLMEDGCDIGP